MLKKESRILFLREFTRQIILNSKPSAGSFDEEEIEIPKEVIKLENYLPGLSHETSSLQQISTETMPSKKRIIQRFPMKMIMPQNIKHSIENPKSIPLIKQYAVPFSQKNIPTLFNPDLNSVGIFFWENGTAYCFISGIDFGFSIECFIFCGIIIFIGNL